MRPSPNGLETRVRRLNLGAQGYPLNGWESVDLHGAPPVDLSAFPWPFADGIATAVNASHVLEHFAKETGKQFLAECYRILAINGVLTLAVPDMDKFITARLTANFAPLNGYRWTDLNHLLGGDQTEQREDYKHRYMYSFESLAWALSEAGFRQIEKRPFDETIDNPAYEAISLYMRAIK